MLTSAFLVQKLTKKEVSLKACSLPHQNVFFQNMITTNNINSPMTYELLRKSNETLMHILLVKTRICLACYF